MTSSKPQFQWDDPFFLEAQLSDEERMVRDAAKAFADDILMPRVIGDFRDEAFDPALLKDMGALGLLGSTIPEEFGGAGVNHVAYGLASSSGKYLPMISRVAERISGMIMRSW